MKDKIVKYVLIVILIIGTIYSFYKKDDLMKNLEYTDCEVIEFEHLGKTYYSVNYIFYVSGQKYIGMVDTSYFKCEDGTKGCVGKKFKVAYSSINPDNNEVDLKKYNKYKTSMNSIFTE